MSEKRRWSVKDRRGEVEVRFAGKGWPRERKQAGAALLPVGVEIAWLDQVHSADVHVVSGPGCGGRGDAIVTGRRGLAPAVVTADCVPVLLASGDQVAAVHAGWRGVVARVVDAAIARFEAPPQVAWIGPAISGAVYEVSQEVAEQVAAVSSQEVILPGRGERPHVDLVRAVEIQLQSTPADVEGPGIEIRRVEHCTFSSAESLWSYRRDGSAAGRNYALIWRS